MILPCLGEHNTFPDVDLALNEPDGLLCFGGDLSVNRLIQAYQKGIFPWYSEGEPLLWWSPSKRMVLKPKQLHLSKSFKKALKKNKPVFFLNRDFKKVISQCAQIPRKDNGTWIHPEMISAYTALFEAGYGFSLEVEIDGQLAGGIYGVKVANIMCGESMFSLQKNGSKYAMYGLCQHMIETGIDLLDCQIHNPHLEKMGANLITRSQFLTYLS